MRCTRGRGRSERSVTHVSPDRKSCLRARAANTDLVLSPKFRYCGYPTFVSLAQCKAMMVALDRYILFIVQCHFMAQMIIAWSQASRIIYVPATWSLPYCCGHGCLKCVIWFNIRAGERVCRKQNPSALHTACL